jgi:phage anti-repressor protein
MEALRREWGHWPAQRFGDLFFIVYWLDHIHVSSKKKLVNRTKGHAKILISLVKELNMVNRF